MYSQVAALWSAIDRTSYFLLILRCLSVSGVKRGNPETIISEITIQS